MSLKLAFDIDGCLANFQDAYIDTCIRVAGKDLFPTRPFDIPCWNYPQFYGYTEEEVVKVWDDIKADDRFWFMLKPYEDAFYAMDEISKLWQAGHDIYFMTDRPGLQAKLQTEAWLLNFRRIPCPTVLVSGQKGPLASSLKIDFLIDDKTENCEQVKKQSNTNVIMLARTWNKDIEGVPRIPDWKAFFEAIKETGETIQ